MVEFPPLGLEWRRAVAVTRNFGPGDSDIARLANSVKREFAISAVFPHECMRLRWANGNGEAATMRQMVAIVLWAALQIAVGSAVRADWLYHDYEDPFSGDRHAGFVTSADGTYGFGFQCTKGQQPYGIFLTPERIKDKSNLSFFKPKVLVIIDDDPRVSLAAEAMAIDPDDQLMFSSHDEAVMALMHRAMKSKRRVAVAVELIPGTLIHSVVLDVDGSTKTIERLIETCGLVPAAN